MNLFTFRMMAFLMSRTISEQFKVLWSVVCFVAIYMVNSFFLGKISAKFLFENKPVFSNISALCAEGMIFFKNIYVSIFSIWMATVLPIPMFFTRCLRHGFGFIPRSISFLKHNKIVFPLFVFKFRGTGFGASKRSPIANIAWSDIVFFFTNWTSFNHVFSISEGGTYVNI